MDDKLTSTITRDQVLKVVYRHGALVGQVSLAVESQKMITLSFSAEFGGEGLGRDRLGHAGLLHNLTVVTVDGHRKVLNNYRVFGCRF